MYVPVKYLVGIQFRGFEPTCSLDGHGARPHCTNPRATAPPRPLLVLYEITVIAFQVSALRQPKIFMVMVYDPIVPTRTSTLRRVLYEIAFQVSVPKTREIILTVT